MGTQEARLSVWKLVIAALVLQCMTLSIFAQGYTGDARRIGMGGTGDNVNIAAKMIEDEQQYRSIVLPFGLIQVIQDRKYFNPDDKDLFNPVRALEDAANPIHLTLRRGAGSSHFVNDIVNGHFSRDLNYYRGFVPAHEVKAEGLAAPSFGYTFRVKKGSAGAFSGIYVGVGPYLSVQTTLNVDDQLRNLLSSDQNVYLKNASLHIANQTFGQAAGAL